MLSTAHWEQSGARGYVLGPTKYPTNWIAESKMVIRIQIPTRVLCCLRLCTCAIAFVLPLALRFHNILQIRLDVAKCRTLTRIIGSFR
jgi:hypothetical protein